MAIETNAHHYHLCGVGNPQYTSQNAQANGCEASLSTRICKIRQDIGPYYKSKKLLVIWQILIGDASVPQFLRGRNCGEQF